MARAERARQTEGARALHRYAVPLPHAPRGGGKIRRTRREYSLLFPDPVLEAKVGIVGKLGRKRLERALYAEAFFKIPVKIPDRRELRHGVVAATANKLSCHGPQMRATQVTCVIF